jgi:hypothetical protein
MTFLLWIMMVMILGLTFGVNTDIPPVNTIITTSEIFSPTCLSLGFGNQNVYPELSFFTWLLLNDRLNTRNILRRRRKFLEDGYNCVLCLEDVEESIEHLFFDCQSAA